MVRLILCASWFLVSVGCWRSEPPSEIVALGEAVEAWREGRQALDDGRPSEAVVAFRRAAKHRPDDVLLGAWEAQALEASGQRQDAIEVLNRVIARSPELGGARHVRARLLAAQDPEAAVDDLIAALKAKALTRHEARRDPLLSPLWGHPSTSFLPEEPLTIVLDVSGRRVFRGDEFDVTLSVQGLSGGAEVDVRGEVAGPAVLATVEEKPTEDLSGEAGRLYRWRLRTTASGEVVVGPIDVDHEGVTVRAAARRIEVVAPEADEVDQAPWPLETPSGRLGDRAVPSVWRGHNGWWVAWPATARLLAPGGGGRAWRLDRSGGDVQMLRLDGPVERVQVGSGARLLLDWAPGDGVDGQAHGR